MAVQLRSNSAKAFVEDVQSAVHFFFRHGQGWGEGEDAAHGEFEAQAFFHGRGT